MKNTFFKTLTTGEKAIFLIAGIVCVIVAFFLIVFFWLINSFSRNEYPEQGLVTYFRNDSLYYEYSEKAVIKLNYYQGDSLKLRKSTARQDWVNSDAELVLSGDFDNFCAYEDNIFILVDNTCYVFDLASYEVPDETNEEVKYSIEEYTIGEFILKYPEHNSFEWYHEEQLDYDLEDELNLKRTAGEIIETSIPVNCEIGYCCIDEDLFIVAELADNEKTDEFIEKFKEKSYEPPFYEADCYYQLNHNTKVFELMPFSNYHYYFYRNDYANKDENPYVFSKDFRLATIDEEENRLYIYVHEDQR